MEFKKNLYLVVILLKVILVVIYFGIWFPEKYLFIPNYFYDNLFSLISNKYTCIVIINIISIAAYLILCIPIKKKEVDICMIPVIMILTSGVLTYYLENDSIGSPFFSFRRVGNNISFSSAYINILCFLIPHITACVGWVTFWAFWSQIRANALTVRNFEKQQITEQYFEMMKMHLDNVKRFSLKFKKYPKVPGFLYYDETVSGIEIFDSLKLNYEKTFIKVKEKIYFLIDEVINKEELTDDEVYISKYKDVINFTTKDISSVVLKDKEKIKKVKANKILWFKLQIHILKNTYYFIYEHNTELDDKHSSSSSKNKFNIKLPNTYGLGYKNQLTHYYRNLFRAVKFIANQDEDLFNYKEKREKLGMLRAQMNNSEQLMLFYNWISSYGEQWENAWKKEKEKENKFLTDYRMIHNLHYDDLDKTIFEGFDKETKKHLLIFLFENLGSILCDSKECNYKAKKYNNDLFEFQDWDKH